ncbi:hypothetical protein [Stetteria hydrogenophila]
MKGVKAVLITRGGDVVVAESLSEAEELIERVDVDAFILIRGEVLSVFKAVRRPQAQPRGAGVERGAGPLAAGGEGTVALVLDQMFRGFAGILERELKDGNIEIHEVVGRGLQSTLKVSDRIYQEPANDDFDVLKLVETLAGRSRLVVFFTGDKKLARQASLLGLGNVVVKYMPPNEYPGKEALTKAMIEAVREALQGG